MSVLNIASTDIAVEIYNRYTALGTKEIMKLFNCSRSAAGKKKNQVRAEQEKSGLPLLPCSVVPTALAYKVWGLDINDLEKRAKKYHALKMAGVI